MAPAFDERSFRVDVWTIGCIESCYTADEWRRHCDETKPTPRAYPDRIPPDKMVFRVTLPKEVAGRRSAFVIDRALHHCPDGPKALEAWQKAEPDQGTYKTETDKGTDKTGKTTDKPLADKRTEERMVAVQRGIDKQAKAHKVAGTAVWKLKDLTGEELTAYCHVHQLTTTKPGGKAMTKEELVEVVGQALVECNISKTVSPPTPTTGTTTGSVPKLADSSKSSPQALGATQKHKGTVDSDRSLPDPKGVLDVEMDLDATSENSPTSIHSETDSQCSILHGLDQAGNWS